MKKMDLQMELIKDRVSVYVTIGAAQFTYDQRVANIPVEDTLGQELLQIIDDVFKKVGPKK